MFHFIYLPRGATMSRLCDPQMQAVGDGSLPPEQLTSMSGLLRIMSRDALGVPGHRTEVYGTQGLYAGNVYRNERCGRMTRLSELCHS